MELQKSLLPKSYPDTELVGFTHRYIPLRPGGHHDQRRASGSATGIKGSVGKAFNDSLDDMADGMMRDLIHYMKDPCFEDDLTLLGQVIDSLQETFTKTRAR